MNKRSYYKHLGEILISQTRIKKAVKRIAGEIEKDFNRNEILFLCNLKGSFRFLSDLISEIHLPLKVEFISFNSYRGTRRCRMVSVVKDIETSIKNRNIIIVEDIIDTGNTMKKVIRYINKTAVKNLKICTLLDKRIPGKKEVQIDYRGFYVDDLFIVGYGLDYKEYYRELNDIYIYQESVNG